MSSGRRWALGFVALWFIGGGTFHFIPVGHAFFTSIVPPWLPSWLPDASALVYISGVLELISAAGLFFERSRRLAGVALILITLGVTPANVHMWMHPEIYLQAPQWLYAVRLVLQVALLGLIGWSTWPQSQRT